FSSTPEVACPLLQEGSHSPAIQCHMPIPQGLTVLKATITNMDQGKVLMDCRPHACRKMGRLYPRLRVTHSNVTMSLEIDPVRRADAGRLTCDVVLKGNATYSGHCDLQVVAVPEKPTCTYSMTSTHVLVSCTTDRGFPKYGCLWTLSFTQIVSSLVPEVPEHKEFYIKGLRYYKTNCSFSFRIQGAGMYKVNITMYPVLTNVINYQITTSHVEVFQELDIFIEEATIEYFVFSHIYGNNMSRPLSSGQSSRVICQTSGQPKPTISLFYRRFLGELNLVTQTVGNILDFAFDSTTCPFAGHFVCTAQNGLNTKPARSKLILNCSEEHCTAPTYVRNDTTQDAEEIMMCVQANPKPRFIQLHTGNKKANGLKCHNEARATNVTYLADAGLVSVNLHRDDYSSHQWVEAISQSIRFPLVEFSLVSDNSLEDEKGPDCPKDVRISEIEVGKPVNVTWKHGGLNQTYSIRSGIVSNSVTLPETQEYSVKLQTTMKSNIVVIEVKDMVGRLRSCSYWLVQSPSEAIPQVGWTADHVLLSLVGLLLLLLFILLIAVISKSKRNHETNQSFQKQVSPQKDYSNDSKEVLDLQTGNQIFDDTFDDKPDQVIENVRHASVVPRVFYRLGKNLQTFQAHLSPTVLNSYLSNKMFVIPKERNDDSGRIDSFKSSVTMDTLGRECQTFEDTKQSLSLQNIDLVSHNQHF
ncbi:hemicentin-1, partial [Biomphalaria glabrata]